MEKRPGRGYSGGAWRGCQAPQEDHHVLGQAFGGGGQHRVACGNGAIGLKEAPEEGGEDRAGALADGPGDLQLPGLSLEKAVLPEPGDQGTAPDHQGDAPVAGLSFLPELQPKELPEEALGLFPHGLLLVDGEADPVSTHEALSEEEP